LLPDFPRGRQFGARSKRVREGLAGNIGGSSAARTATGAGGIIPEAPPDMEEEEWEPVNEAGEEWMPGLTG
jgi:hypothetical protein